MLATPALCDARELMCVGVRRMKGTGDEVAVMWKGRGAETEASKGGGCLEERMCTKYG